MTNPTLRTLVFRGVLLCLAGCGGSRLPDTSINFRDIERNMDEMVKLGTIKKIDLNANAVYVSRPQWTLFNVEQRTVLGYLAGHYCGHKDGTNVYTADILDFGTGKRLARWSKTSGYQNHE